MRALETLLPIVVLLFLAAPAAHPQAHSPSMTPEDAARMADDMLEQISGMMGIDPETLRNASEEQRQKLLRQGAEGFAAGMRERMEELFGVPLEEMEQLDETELRSLFQDGADRHSGAGTRLEPLPLGVGPSQGFGDGSEPLEVGPDYIVRLGLHEPRGREIVLVAVDLRVPRIVHQQRHTVPFTASLQLGRLSDDPTSLVFELVDAVEGRVLRRFRPVAAETGQASR